MTTRQVKIELKNVTIWRGRQEIEKGTGKKFPTIKKWKREYHCPLRHDPGRGAYMIEFEYVLWLQRYDDYQQETGPLSCNLPTPHRAGPGRGHKKNRENLE